jgi:hypothetical protein
VIRKDKTERPLTGITKTLCRRLLIGIVALLFFFTTVNSNGQPQNPPPPDPADPVPIEGAEILIMAGVAFGIFKLLRRRGSRSVA